MIGNSTNIDKKNPTCEPKRSSTNTLLKPPQVETWRNRSKSASQISSKQSTREGQLQRKINYKLSPEHVLLLIEDEKIRDKEFISQSEALSHYYNCFNNLFKIIYLSAETAIKHSFYNKEQELNFEKLQIIGSLIGEFQPGWSLSKSSKFIILSENVYQLSKNLPDFQQRMEYVARKICRNKSKKLCIQNASLNSKLKKSWQEIQQNQEFILNNHFLFDMFETDVEKLCYFDVHRFINKCLCKAEFRELIVRTCRKQETDKQTKVDFTFEFFLIEEFCLGDDFQGGQVQLKGEKQQNKCKIM